MPVHLCGDCRSHIFIFVRINVLPLKVLPSTLIPCPLSQSAALLVLHSFIPSTHSVFLLLSSFTASLTASNLLCSFKYPKPIGLRVSDLRSLSGGAILFLYLSADTSDSIDPWITLPGFILFGRCSPTVRCHNWSSQTHHR